MYGENGMCVAVDDEAKPAKSTAEYTQSQNKIGKKTDKIL